MDTLKWIILFVTIPAVLCAVPASSGLGDYCTTECDVLHSFCEYNICACEKNYTEVKDKCVAVLADKCTKANECLASNSHCKDGRCQCLPGRSLVDGKCVFKLSSYCEKDNDCGITNSKCLENKCTCVPHYFELLEQCVTGVNASCYGDYQCKAKHSVCLDNKCQCEDNFAATPDYQCFPFASHHKPCKYDEQCSSSMPHTSCNVTDEGQRCECTAKYFFKEGECYPRKYVPDKCDRFDDCFTENSYCKNGQCACLPSFELKDGACNSSAIAQPLLFFVALIVLAMKVLL